MTTRELYSSIGVSGYEHEGCWRKDGIFHIQMEAPPSCHKCPKCGNRDVIHRGTFTRVVHAAPIGKDRTVLFIKAPRLECRRCVQVLSAVLPNVVPLRKSSTDHQQILLARLRLKLPLKIILKKMQWNLITRKSLRIQSFLSN